MESSIYLSLCFVQTLMSCHYMIYKRSVLFADKNAQAVNHTYGLVCCWVYRVQFLCVKTLLILPMIPYIVDQKCSSVCALIVCTTLYFLRRSCKLCKILCHLKLFRRDSTWHFIANLSDDIIEHICLHWSVEQACKKCYSYYDYNCALLELLMRRR